MITKNLLNKYRTTLSAVCAAAALVVPVLALAQTSPTYRSSNLVMGYVSPGEAVNVAGYPQCFTSIGDRLWVRADNSANKNPLFEVSRVNDTIQVKRNGHANGTGTYVCHNERFNNDEILAGYVTGGSTIEPGLSCVVSIANFQKFRRNGGGTGTVGCSYDPATGRIATSATGAGKVTSCGYVCVKPDSLKTTQATATSFTKVFSGTENIGSNLSCAAGVNYFYSKCSGTGVLAASYSATSGVATKGVNACTRASMSYLCATKAAFQCADKADNDEDGVIDAQDPGCWTNPSNPASYDPNRPDESAATTECQDDLDNDSDGAIDLADFSCGNNRLHNDEETPKSQCQDGIDNDNDGDTDLDDFSCQNNPQRNDEVNPKPLCQDGIDNDKDGAVDLKDFSCENDPQKNDEATPKSQCQDGIDNDGDGASDLLDFSCQSNPQKNDESGPNSQCQDEIDNDGDGASDLADFSCQNNPQRNDEVNPKPQCQDGIDNDGDGAVDLADFSCMNDRQRNNESTPRAQCQDSIDNDGDGATDMADFSCSSNQDNDEANPKSQCQDGIDNDGDGAVDLADSGCSNGQDNSEVDSSVQCQDGVDNDKDGAVDMADFSCSSPSDNDEANPKAQCQDGVDNDGDGAVDTSDFSCSSNQDNDESNPKAQCQDGIDNDGDNAIDMSDFSCSSKQDNDEANPRAQCQDGIDNDADGAIDLGDFSCSSNQDNDESNPKSQCQDGLDNDLDGLTDNNDPACSSNQQGNTEGSEPSLLEVGVDCVSNNGDGTFTAYFGYDNRTGRELVVTSNPSIGSVNALSPGASSRGQPIFFDAGRRKGSAPITFNGAPLTWSVRAPGGRLSTATASFNSTPCQPVTPTADCINGSASGFVATFGYNNPNGFDIILPVGKLNSIFPAPANRGQPTLLKAGRNSASFTSSFSQTISWSLNGRTAAVNSSTPICEGGCIDQPVGTITSELNQTALTLADLTKQAARRLAQRAKARAAKGQISRAEAARAGVDAERAAKKADELARRANELTLSFPAVVKTCPFSPPFCQTVDRGSEIEQLRGLFVEQVNQTRRIVARSNFNNTGETSRTDPLVLESKRVKAEGDAQLSQLPRIATECK